MGTYRWVVETPKQHGEEGHLKVTIRESDAWHREEHFGLHKILKGGVDFFTQWLDKPGIKWPVGGELQKVTIKNIGMLSDDDAEKCRQNLDNLDCIITINGE